MDYETKYKEALDRAKKVNESKADDRLPGTRICEYIFPELKEEDGDRIKKWLIAQLKIKLGDNATLNNMIFKAIAWIEKQDKKEDPQVCNDSESEGSNVVDPKFETGDWIIQENIGVYRVIEVCETWYEVVDNKDKDYSIGFDKEHMLRLWTIEDAKDGDVLVASDGSIFIFAGVFDCACKYYITLTTTNDVKINKEKKGGYWETSRAVHPATKEQCNFLFSKMKEAGYEWDTEKKELKKLPNSYCQENCKGFQETGRCYADGGCQAKIEAESAEKTEPNFKVGDWIVRKDGKRFSNGRKYAQITEIDGEKHWFDTGLIYLKAEDMRPWIFEDAEDGDILYNKKHDMVWRYKNTKGCDDSGGTCVMSPNDITPATEEQRNELFSKMLKAYYERI